MEEACEMRYIPFCGPFGWPRLATEPKYALCAFVEAPNGLLSPDDLPLRPNLPLPAPDTPVPDPGVVGIAEPLL